MKRCPQCGREYDNTMMFCLDDGAELLYGPASMDEPATAILHSTAAPGEAPTRAQIYTTEQTAVLQRGTETEPQKNLSDSTEKQSFSANRAAKPLAALVVAVVILVGGFFGYRYLSPARQINSIAVMPFENRNSDADTDYLSDGLAESLIFRLTQIPDLKVSPTSSVMRYKGKETDIAKIASELGVDAVMTGRLTKRGDNLNITVELVDARTNKSLWGEQYERKLSELLTTQREIVAEIVGKLQLKLSGESEQKLAKKYTDNNEAYQLYLKGRFHSTKYTPEGFNKGIEYFNQAIALDPNYALAYDGLAYCYYSNWYIQAQEAAAKGKSAAKKALEIDPTLAEAHASLASMYAWYDYDWAAAEREFRQSIKLNPNYGLAHGYYGILLASMGRFDEAIAESKRAVELEPLSAEYNTLLGMVYFYAKRFDEASAQLKKTIEFEPNFWWAHNYLGRTYLQSGKLPDALVELEQARRMEGATVEVLGALGYAYALSGRRDEAQKIIAELKNPEKRIESDGYEIAVIYAALGEKDQAFAYLDKEYATGGWMLNFLKVDPYFNTLRDDPRFKDLLKRMGLPE